jgi:predicted HTH domain antitoxin
MRQEVKSPRTKSISIGRCTRLFKNASFETLLRVGTFLAVSCFFLIVSLSFSRMTVTIPDDLIGNMQLNEQDVLVDIAIGLYKREQVSLGRAAEIANMSSPAFLDELGRRKIPINYDINDLHADLASLRDAH